MLPKEVGGRRRGRGVHFTNLGKAVLNQKSEALKRHSRWRDVCVREGGAPYTVQPLLPGPSAPEADTACPTSSRVLSIPVGGKEQKDLYGTCQHRTLG